MTVAATQDFGALLGKSGFDLSAFGAAMSPSVAQPTPANYVEKAPEQDIGVGQMRAETPETAAAVDNLAAKSSENLGGLDSIRKGLEEKAAALEGQALAASQPAAAQEENSFEKYAKNGETAPLLAFAFDMVTGGAKGQGQDCDMNDVQCQNVGTQQQSQGIAARR